MANRKNWAVFVDRDGTINEEVNYLGDPAQLKLTPGAAKAIHQLNSHNIPVIVVTNQAGIARGYFTIAQMHLVHQAPRSDASRRQRQDRCLLLLSPPPHRRHRRIQN